MKIVLRAEARIAAKKRADAYKDSQNLLAAVGLPGKLWIARRADREKSELSWSKVIRRRLRESGRDRMYPARAAIARQVLNVEKSQAGKSSSRTRNRRV